MDGLRLILAAFAIYRLSQLFHSDEGPLDMLKTARENAAIRSGDSRFWEVIAKLYACPFCLGIWFAALAMVMVMKPTGIGDTFLLWFGLAGAQSFLQSRSIR